MRPGQDCLSCHSGSGSGPGVTPGHHARTFTVAGTVFPSTGAAATDGVEGAQVLVTDAAGRTVTLTTNTAGNFYTAETLQLPVSVQVQLGGARMAMTAQPLTGGCNSCHGDPPADGAPGRLFVPIR